MPPLTFSAAAVVLVAVLCVGPVRAQRRDANRTVVVRIVNDVNVPEAVVRSAAAGTTAILRRAGIEPVWARTGGDISRAAVTVKLAQPPAGNREVSSRALGVTRPPSNSRPDYAWVFYERVRDRAAMLKMSEPILLGAVIAHELGHVMLPRGYHSNVGLMREAWDRQQMQAAVWGQLVFSSREAASIRASAVDLAAALPLAPAR